MKNWFFQKEKLYGFRREIIQLKINSLRFEYFTFISTFADLFKKGE